MPIFEGADPEVSNASDVVSGCDSAALHDAIAAACGKGWMVSVSGSRDGYAVSFAVWVNGQKEARWHTTSESLERALYAVVRAAAKPDEVVSMPDGKKGVQRRLPKKA